MKPSTTENSKPGQTIDSDQPITTSANDRFGREQFAHRIADVISARTDSSNIAIGITAPWGEGKTSVLNMIEERLKEHNILILNFNPWRFSNEESLLRNFYFELASVLEVGLETTSEKAGNFLRQNAKVAAAAKIFGISADEGVEGLAALFPEVKIEELKTRIESKLDAKKSRIVILIDDIDRLDVDEIQAVFRLIKLSANFPYISYVASFDEARVAEALSQKYGATVDSGRKFLEKILQVSLPLPPASSQALMTMTIEGINAALAATEIETDTIQEKRFSEFFAKAFRPRITTPRLVKRFVSAIAFVLPIMKGEVNPTDLIFIEAIKVFYPELYAAIRANGDNILNYIVGDEILGQKDKKLAGEIEQAISTALKSVPSSSKSGIELLLQDLFPNLAGLPSLSRPYVNYSTDNPIEQKRISTREYFWRYFSYGIQPHDISDNEVTVFLAEIPTHNIDFVKNFLRNYFDEKDSRIDTVINKLRLQEDTLESAAAILLARGLSDLSELFPNCHPDDLFVGGGTRHQIARLMMHLSNSVGEAEREALFAEIVESTPDALYAYDFASMIRGFGEKIEATEKGWVVICDGIERKVNKIVSNRIRGLADQFTLEDFNFPWAQDLYIFWFHNDAETLASYFKEKLVQGTESFLQCVGGLIRFDVTGSKGFTSYVHHQLPWFGIIDSLIDTKLALDAIERDFPDVANEATSKDLTKRLASAFVTAYREANP